MRKILGSRTEATREVYTVLNRPYRKAKVRFTRHLNHWWGATLGAVYTLIVTIINGERYHVPTPGR
jgi:hypothetical protein